MTTFVNRAVLILKADTTLRASPVEDSLVTNVIAQEPPVDTSPDTSVIPVIYCYYSKNPIRKVDFMGRDSLNTAGARDYHIEFYNLAIARGINKRDAEVKVQRLSELIRDNFQKNLRLAVPATFADPLCAQNEVIAVPYVLRSSNPNIQAINVICRPNVPVSLR